MAAKSQIIIPAEYKFDFFLFNKIVLFATYFFEFI